MRKNYKHYIKQVTQKINEDPPVNTCYITEKETRVVLRYFIKNMMSTIHHKHNEVHLKDRLRIRPHKGRIAAYWNFLYRKKRRWALRLFKSEAEKRRLIREFF